jgi:hypothetical protein
MRSHLFRKLFFQVGQLSGYLLQLGGHPGPAELGDAFNKLVNLCLFGSRPVLLVIGDVDVLVHDEFLPLRYRGVHILATQDIFPVNPEGFSGLDFGNLFRMGFEFNLHGKLIPFA